MFLCYLNYEIAHVETGIMSVQIQAAHVCCATIASVVFMIPMGCSHTIASVIGRCVGKEKPKKAQAYALSSFLFLLVTSFPICICLVIFRDFWPKIFTNDREVQENVGSVAFILSCCSIAGAVEMNMQGLLRGLGMQIKATYIYLLMYYTVGMPIGAVLAFVFETKLEGIWIG